MPVALRFLAIMLLKAGPQHLPYSITLLAGAAVLYVLSGIMVLSSSMGTEYALGNMLLDVAVLFAFSYLCLRLLHYPKRFVQMVSALAGIGVVYHLLAWPLFMQIYNMQPEQQGGTIFALLMLLLLSWQVLVYAHVFRHAMEMSFGRALALSFGYLFLSIAAAEFIFPGS